MASERTITVGITCDTGPAELGFVNATRWLGWAARKWKHHRYASVRNRARLATRETFERQYATQRANKLRRVRRR